MNAFNGGKYSYNGVMSIIRSQLFDFNYIGVYRYGHGLLHHLHIDVVY